MNSKSQVNEQVNYDIIGQQLTESLLHLLQMKLNPKTSRSAIHGTEALLLVWIIGILTVISVLTTFSSLYLVFKLRLLSGSNAVQAEEKGQVVFKHDLAIATMKLMSNRLSGVQIVDGNILMQSGKSQISIGDDGIDVMTPHGLHVVSPQDKEADLSSRFRLSAATVIDFLTHTEIRCQKCQKDSVTD
jgi:hypothetical protein